MKTQLVPLVGDPIENLYQLGLREKEAFLKIESRVTKLLSTNSLLQYGQDIVSRARVLMKKKQNQGLFEKCIAAYAEGLGVDVIRYQSFISLLEVAAHYGQTYPELKGLLPGCTSVFAATEEGITHSRLLDFPLIDLYEESPRLYYWQMENKPPLLTYGCEGLAPLFFQGLHGSGMSFALHHKPGKHYHQDGQSIFKILFEDLFEASDLNSFKRQVRARVSVTKWAFLLLDKSGQVQVIDIDGPAFNSETYNVHETSPLIFTNIPLQKDQSESETFIKFSEDRQNWLKQKLKEKSSAHMLDLMTDVEDQKSRGWLHPAATLTTIGAYHVNLSKGYLDLKEGQSALVASDEIIRVSLGDHQNIQTLKKASTPKPFEVAWKRAARAQSAFDQGKFDEAYHELQMARALMPHPIWKEVFGLYLHIWDFKFISNSKELSLVYKKVKTLKLPENLKDQWILLLMRFEKRLDLVPTVTYLDVSTHFQELFQQEKIAAKPVFATWMKLLYPRLELLDVFSPHHK